MDLKNNQLNEEETALLQAMPWLNENKVEQTAMKQLLSAQRILEVDPTGLSQAEQQVRAMAEEWLCRLGVSHDVAIAHRLGVLPNWTDPAHNDGASEPAMLLPTGVHDVTSADDMSVSVNDGPMVCKRAGGVRSRRGASGPICLDRRTWRRKVRACLSRKASWTLWRSWPGA